MPLLVNRGHGYKPVAGELADFYIPEFVYIRGVPNDRGQMAEQTRPVFQDWSIEFTVKFDEQIVNEKDVKMACENMVLGSFRPRFGRVTLQQFGTPVKAKSAG